MIPGQGKIHFQPTPSILAIIDRDEWYSGHNFSTYTSAVTGSAFATKGIKKMIVGTGTTAGSTAVIRSSNDQGLSSGKDRDSLNWSKRILVHIFTNQILTTTNGISRFSLGKNTTLGALADKGIGIQIANGALSGIVHDGSSGASVDLSTTMVNGIVIRVTIHSDGSDRE